MNEINNKPPSWLTPITSLAKDLFRAEFSSTPGRLNFFLMLLSLILVFLLALPPWIEAIVNLFRPEADIDLPIVQLLSVYLIFNLICVGVVGYLELSNRGEPPKHLRR